MAIHLEDWIKIDLKPLYGPYGLISAVLGVSILWFASGMMKPHAAVVAPKVVAPPLFKVQVTTLKASPLFQEVISRGSVVAGKTVPLYAQTAGEVVKIAIPKGSNVKKGDALIILRDNDTSRKFEEAKTRLKQREIEYKASQELAHKSFNSKITLAQNKTNLDAALSAFASAQHALNMLTIKAPFNGTFNASDLEEGSFVGSVLMLGNPIGTMIDLSFIKVVLQIPEKDVFSVQIGQDVNLSSPFSPLHQTGKVAYISKSADPKLRTYKVEILAPNDNLAFYEGMTIQAKIPVQKIMAHLINFSSLCLDENGIVGVKTVDADSNVVFTPVSVIKTESGKVWVSGLPDTAHLITLGSDFVIQGQKVEISPKPS